MPELPEVETIKTLVNKRVENKKIKKTKVLNPKLRWRVETRKINNLANKTIKSVQPIITPNIVGIDFLKPKLKAV